MDNAKIAAIGETAVLPAEKIMPELTEDEARALRSLAKKFSASYRAKGDISDREWLSAALRTELPDMSAEQSKADADEIIDAIEVYDADFRDINEAAQKGVSAERWLEGKLREASSSMSVQQYGETLAQIDAHMNAVNEQMAEALRRADGLPNMNPRLHGNIAEGMHAASFEMSAELRGSSITVKVPTSNSANSVDIQVFRPESGHAAQNYQLKFCRTAEDTFKAIQAGDYRNQRIIVPKEQLADVQRLAREHGMEKTITDRIDIDGVEGSSFSYEEMTQMRDEWQQKGAAPEVTYSNMLNRDIAMQIGRQAGTMALQSAAISAGITIAQRVFSGEELTPDELMETAITTGADAGAKVVVSGAATVAIRKGLLSAIPPGTPTGVIANVACVGVENAKILWRWTKGEITFTQAVEQMRRTTVSMSSGLYGMLKGSAAGTAAGMALVWIPLIGTAMPAVGGFIGGMVGYMAGSKIGEKLHDAAVSFKKKVKDTAKRAWEVTKSAGEKIWSGVKNTVSAVASGVKSFVSSLFSW